MGRLKIGSGIQFKAELPKVERSEPKVEQSSSVPSGLDVMALIQKAIDALPKPEQVLSPKNEVISTQKEVDLSPLQQRLDALENRQDLMSTDLDALHEKVKDASEIVYPEVKQVTHVQDVSPEVLKKCKEMLKYSEEALMLKICDLQKKEQKQKKMNYVLSGIVLITIFLHLI